MVRDIWCTICALRICKEDQTWLATLFVLLVRLTATWIYEAASNGEMNINYAWSEDGIQPTKYPAQVRICNREQCKSFFSANCVIVDGIFRHKDTLCFIEIIRKAVICR